MARSKMEYLVGPVEEREPLYIGEQRGRVSLRLGGEEKRSVSLFPSHRKPNTMVIRAESASVPRGLPLPSAAREIRSASLRQALKIY